MTSTYSRGVSSSRFETGKIKKYEYKNGGLAIYPNKIGPAIYSNEIGQKHGVSAGDEHRLHTVTYERSN